MRIVYFGTPDLAVPGLAAVSLRHEVTGVVCQPDRPKGRSKKLVAPAVKVWAVAHGIEVHQPLKLNDGSFEAWLRGHEPDVCCLAAYGRILREAILDVPRHGFLNIHPSMLPKYRGVSPIQTAVLHGEERTGVTIMHLDAGIDTGDILLQESAAILPEDTSGTLTARLGELGADLLVRGLDLVERGEAVFERQDDSQATHTEFFKKEMGRIEWSKGAWEIHHQVRATHPWPVAHCLFRGAVCRIHRSAVVEGACGAAPGVVTDVEKDRFVVATGDGQLAVLVFQAPGKKAMPVGDYLRGQKLSVGESFEGL